jgi:hypothetical protein
MNFDRINGARIIVGSHPGNAADIDQLYTENAVRAIENLQQSGEWDRGDIDAITAKCAVVGNRIWYQRVPIEDGQWGPLRQKLPEAVGILDKAIQRATGPEETVYLHCRAGKRRSPSVAAAYLYWFGDDTTFDLDAACDRVEAQRPDSTTDREAIRAATYDILGRNNNGPDNFHGLPRQAFRTITAVQRGLIQTYVTELPRVTNA